jgi:hypothetical protein
MWVNRAVGGAADLGAVNPTATRTGGGAVYRVLKSLIPKYLGIIMYAAIHGNVKDHENIDKMLIKIYFITGEFSK